MWKLESTGKVIKEGKSWTNPDTGITYPTSWGKFSDEEKISIGLVWEDDPVKVDRRFYWSENNPKILDDRPEFDDDGVTPILDGNGEQVITKGLKSVWISKVKDQQGYALAPTDYRITKAKELSKLVDINTLHHRFNIRETAKTKEQFIEATTTIEEFIDYVTSQDFHTWPLEDSLEGKYVPPVITKKQAFDLLKTMTVDDGNGGTTTLKVAVLNFISNSGDEDLQDDFNNTNEFNREDPAIEGMRVAFSWTQEQMDDFFITAYGM